jgi:VWFA-related protein
MSNAGQAPSVEIVSPKADAVIIGTTRLEAVLTPSVPADRVAFFVDGRTVCTPTAPPYACTFDAGAAAREHHIRVVAYLGSGGRAVANIRTKDIGYTERIDVDAVQVPVVVTSGNRFVRGLKIADFSLAEDEVPQRIESLAADEMPLDLVLAIDISGSMTNAIDGVKRAVKQLLAKLRPGDTATLIGFNENTFTVAEREIDPQTREDAVDLLSPWGGTALYDATIKALELVQKRPGRKGVVIFSDGDDQDSLARRETAMARVQASDAMLFTIAFGRGAEVPTLRRGLEEYARVSGGRAFFAASSKDLDAVFGAIVEELANQYVLSYSPREDVRNGQWHRLKVAVKGHKYDVRAREGYRRTPARAGR